MLTDEVNFQMNVNRCSNNKIKVMNNLYNVHIFPQFNFNLTKMAYFQVRLTSIESFYNIILRAFS